MAHPADSGNADLYSPTCGYRQDVHREEYFASVRSPFAEVVSTTAANPRPLYRHGSAPGAFPQPNRRTRLVAEGVDLGAPCAWHAWEAAVSNHGYKRSTGIRIQI